MHAGITRHIDEQGIVINRYSIQLQNIFYIVRSVETHEVNLLTCNIAAKCALSYC